MLKERLSCWENIWTGPGDNWGGRFIPCRFELIKAIAKHNQVPVALRDMFPINTPPKRMPRRLLKCPHRPNPLWIGVFGPALSLPAGSCSQHRLFADGTTQRMTSEQVRASTANISDVDHEHSTKTLLWQLGEVAVGFKLLRTYISHLSLVKKHITIQNLCGRTGIYCWFICRELSYVDFVEITLKSVEKEAGQVKWGWNTRSAQAGLGVVRCSVCQWVCGSKVL